MNNLIYEINLKASVFSGVDCNKKRCYRFRDGRVAWRQDLLTKHRKISKYQHVEARQGAGGGGGTAVALAERVSVGTSLFWALQGILAGCKTERLHCLSYIATATALKCL